MAEGDESEANWVGSSAEELMGGLLDDKACSLFVARESAELKQDARGVSLSSPFRAAETCHR